MPESLEPAQSLDSSELAGLTPAAARRLFRAETYTGPTSGIAVGFVQANMVILPAKFAEEFGDYCHANSKPCPLLERLPAGEYRTRNLAAQADLRTDLPRYRIYRSGRPFTECLKVTEFWRQDFVSFLLGCSFTFEEAMVRAGLPVRHIEEGRNVPMYRTCIPTTPEGPFGGPMVVSMRPIPSARVAEAYSVTAACDRVHGAPMHHGDPAALGIGDLSRPEWGQPVTIRPGEVPVFWACGVTSQVALENALARGLIDLAITHSPGHMFIADCRYENLPD